MLNFNAPPWKGHKIYSGPVFSQMIVGAEPKVNQRTIEHRRGSMQVGYDGRIQFGLQPQQGLMSLKIFTEKMKLEPIYVALAVNWPMNAFILRAYSHEAKAKKIKEQAK